MIAYVLIIVGFMMRLLPHAPNVVPVAAIAIFAGAYLDRKIVPWVPLGIMILSDLIIGLHGMVFYTWGAFLLIGFLSTYLKQHRTWGNIFMASIFSALLFFMITNFGVWIGWYPHTWEGFMTCYINAVPFLRNTMLSNLVFTFVFFGLYELAKKMVETTRFRKVLLAE